MLSLLFAAVSVASASLITFSGDYKTTVEGALINHQDIWVDYDPSRAKCDATPYDGTIAGWTVSLHYKFNGKVETQKRNTVAHYFDGVVKERLVIHDAPKGDLEIWFSCANDSGIATYDSNFGNNYHFQVL